MAQKTSTQIADAQLRRKVNKPLVEKRRRERINKYLYELHALLTESGSAVPTNKIEKADILEMAVSHIRNLKKQIKVKYDQLQQQPLPQQQQDIPQYQTLESLNIQIPSRVYSPASSVSSSGSSDYPSPPANYVQQQRSQAMLQQQISQLLPIQGQTFTLLLQQQQQQQQHIRNVLLPQQNTMQQTRVHQRQIVKKSNQQMWRPW